MREKRYFSRYITVFCLVIAFCGVSLFAQKSPKARFLFPALNPIEMPQVDTVELGNGLKLFLVEDHEYPTIDLRAMVRGGSVFEQPSQIGLAAVTGQVLRSGGTTSMTGDEIDEELETLAASVSTGIGLTSGYITVSVFKEDLDRALQFLADILMNPVFQEDKIILAKIQQRSGIHRRNDDIGQIAFREFNKLIYGKDSPYARHPEFDTVDSITRDDIVSFYQKYFSPNNTIMAAWGDFDSSDLKTKIKKALGGWEAAKKDIPPLPEVNYEYKRTVNVIDKPDVNQSHILIGHLGGLMDNPDYPALSVMNAILSYQRMFKKIRTDEGLAYSVWGSYGANFRVPGVFSCGAQTKSESTVYAIELMLEEVKRIKEEEVTQEELAKAKDQYLNSFIFNFDSRAKIVNRLMTYDFFGYPLDFMERVRKNIEKVTKKDVHRVAKKYLRPDKVQILVVGKKEEFDKPLSTLGEVRVVDITIPRATPKKK